jgi:3-deoxy-D-manno-octulosonate 8-phosphate phosphatase KdsC-like HAD superfamily phosphatase
VTGRAGGQGAAREVADLLLEARRSAGRCHPSGGA